MNVIGILMGIALNMMIAFDSIVIFAMVILRICLFDPNIVSILVEILCFFSEIQSTRILFVICLG
jgi:poly(A) polymerase Pap1